jgi:tRNA U34 5-carboxymethylaminomethyl modifying enzyme MnmG/GidA
MYKFDVIVVGGGHAGVEAAHAVYRMGLSCALVTFEKKKIGQMSCNPAIGGLGKSHIVREVGAMGGSGPLATDLAGIQYRTLNTRKGDAVQALRVQCDRDLYKKAVQKILYKTNIEFFVLLFYKDLYHTEPVALEQRLLFLCLVFYIVCPLNLLLEAPTLPLPQPLLLYETFLGPL